MIVMKLPLIIASIKAYLSDVFAIDYRSLALIRISVGFVVLLDLINRFQHASVFYTDHGVLPRKDAIAGISQFRWSVLFSDGTSEFVNLVFIVGFISAIAMIVGWRTRIVTVVLWIIVTSLQARNPHLSSGADTLMLVTLLWTIVLLLGTVWSANEHPASPLKELAKLGARFNLVSSVASFRLAYFLNSGTHCSDTIWFLFPIYTHQEHLHTYFIKRQPGIPDRSACILSADSPVALEGA